MPLEFTRACVKVGGSKAVIIPPELLTALELTDTDEVTMRYYEKEKNGKTKKYVSLWKTGT